MDEVEVVNAHSERATLRVGNVFLKVDSDRARLEREVDVMALVPVPAPKMLWHKPSVLAVSAVPGTVLGRIGSPSPSSPAAWAAAGAVVRKLHDAPAPPWDAGGGQNIYELAAKLDEECKRLVRNGLLPADMVARNRAIAEAALRPYTPAFIHGDLHVTHVFADGDEITGIIDWSEGGRGDAVRDLASLTLAHPEHLSDVLAGYGGDVDLELVHAWWSMRALLVVRWLSEHGFNPFSPGGEADVLRARM
jgi:aminoglycoside phosphotransferase (APT) family kinase protein